MIDIEVLLDEAFAAFETRRFGEAEELCRRVLDGNRKNVDALHLLGVIAGATDRKDVGIRLLREVLELNPECVEALADLGHLLKEERQDAEAVAVLGRALRLDAESVNALNNLGQAHLEAERLSQAVACFERAIAVDPDLAVLHYNLGIALQKQDRIADAIAAYRRALALAPDLAEPCVRLGNLLIDNGEPEEALVLLARAQPDSDLGRQCAAMIDIEEGQVLKAEERLRSVIASEVTDIAALCILGGALSRLGRFDETIACFERAIALDPERAQPYAGIIANKSVTPAELPLIARMKALIDKRGLTEHARAILHFAVGKAYDDLGDYRSAISHFEKGNRIEANRLRDAGRVFDCESFAAGISAMIATVTPQFFAGHARIGSDSELPVLIVGMPRSGTTLVEQIVSSHPDVSAGDELTFWTDRAGIVENGEDPLTIAFASKAAADYLALLQRFSPAAQRVTDKMPTNFLVLGLVHSIFPRARIIHCRRNPIDTCLSIYFTHFSQLPDFAFDRSKLVFYYQQYLRLMTHWRKVLPPDRFFELDYEELVTDREYLSRQLIEFCGLEWRDECLRHEDNARAVKTASMWQARQPIYRTSVERWRRYEPWLGEFARLVDCSLNRTKWF